jgi:hypothetical protein
MVRKRQERRGGYHCNMPRLPIQHILRDTQAIGKIPFVRFSHVYLADSTGHCRQSLGVSRIRTTWKSPPDDKQPYLCKVIQVPTLVLRNGNKLQNSVEYLGDLSCSTYQLHTEHTMRVPFSETVISPPTPHSQQKGCTNAILLVSTHISHQIVLRILERV